MSALGLALMGLKAFQSIDQTIKQVSNLSSVQKDWLREMYLQRKCPVSIRLEGFKTSPLIINVVSTSRCSFSPFIISINAVSKSRHGFSPVTISINAVSKARYSFRPIIVSISDVS